MQAGTIVEYIDRQKILCAAVLEIKSNRLRLISENAREVTLAPQRLSHVSGTQLELTIGRDAIVQVLKDTASRRDELASHIDIKSFWELLNTEREWIDLATMTGFVFPDGQDSDHESAVVRAFFRNRLYFKFNANAFFPYTEEQARQVQKKFDSEEKRRRLISSGVTWLKSTLLDSKTTAYDMITGDCRKALDILKSHYLFGKDAETHAVAKAILSGAGLKNPEDLFRIFVKAGIWHENENLDLHYYRIPITFSEEIIQHASNLGRNEKSAASNTTVLGQRKDLTHLQTTTIDGPSTLDFDDALSIEDKGGHYFLGIHISDVGEVVPKGDIIDLEASSRGSSIYLPELNIPMIPTELSENTCSLIAGRQRPAISVMVTIAPDGKIRDADVFPSIVTVKRQLTYTDANIMAESDPDIVLLHTIARRFRQQRLNDGAVHISLPEISIRFGESYTPKVVRVEREAPSRMLISELMILANSVMADFLIKNNVPAVFRSQPEPRERLYKGDNGSLFQNWMQRKSLSRFVLGTRGERHSGLGLDAYVTATSPIRKYYDLITQRQIRAALGLEPPYSEKEIESLLKKLEHPMGYVPKVQYGRTRFWLLRYLETRIGEKEEAVVLTKRKDGYQILLPAYMIECFMAQPGNIKLKPQDYLRVTIQNANPRKGELTVYLG